MPNPGVQFGSLTVDPGSIATTTRGSVAVAFTNLRVGDLLILEPPAALNNSLVYEGFSIAADQVTIFLRNLSLAAIDDSSRTWRYAWLQNAAATLLGQDPR